MKIPVAEWLPDVAELDAGVASVARNVFPAANSYQPIKRATAYSGVMEVGATPCGLGVGNTQLGAFKVIGGSTNKLWLLDGTVWDEAGSGYSATTDERWSFTQFGTAFLAGNINTALQVIDLDGGTTFSSVTGSPPKARFWDTVSDFVIAAGLESNPQAVQWSGINDYESWTPGTDLSDIQEFPDGGRIMNVTGAGEIIVQERKLRRMIRAPGSGLAFTFQEITAARGTIAPFSVIKYGGGIAYLAEDGFWFNDQPIGKGKVDKYFLSQADNSLLYSVIGTFDPTGPRLIWIYKSGAAEYYDKGLVYDWSLGRWSDFDTGAYGDIGGLWDISNLGTPGLSLEDLDALYATLEDVEYSLDSRVWLGGRPVLAGLGSEGKLVFFEGANALATMETGEAELIPGYRSLITAARPLVESSACTVQIGKRDRLADTRTWGTAADMVTSGRNPVRASGRYLRLRATVPAGETWTHFQGFDIPDTNVSKLGAR